MREFNKLQRNFVYHFACFGLNSEKRRNNFLMQKRSALCSCDELPDRLFQLKSSELLAESVLNKSRMYLIAVFGYSAKVDELKSSIMS